MKRFSGWRRAALTVEALFLIPWMVILTALLIILLFFFHNRTWYEAAGLEAGLAGNQYIAGSGGSGLAGSAETGDARNDAGTAKAEQTVRERIADQAMPGVAPEAHVTCTNQETRVSFSGGTYPLFSDRFSLEIQETVKKVRPVPILRGSWMVKKVVDGADG